MSGESSIQWCDATWNPTRGCSVISEGCHNCYAMKQAHRFSGPGRYWPLRYKGHPDAIAEGRPTRIFVNSMSDLFHESLSDSDIDRVFAVMALSPKHTFQVLTKRAKRMRDYLRDSAYRAEQVGIDAEALSGLDRYTPTASGIRWPFPLPNVWLGVSAENQERADERIPDLLATPAAVRFVSAEPLIGPIDFTRITEDEMGTSYNALTGVYDGNGSVGPRLDWVIVGGES